MGLCPDEASCDELDLIESLDLAETDGEKLSTLPLAEHPGRPQVPSAEPTEGQDGLLGDAHCDICS